MVTGYQSLKIAVIAANNKAPAMSSEATPNTTEIKKFLKSFGSFVSSEMYFTATKTKMKPTIATKKI